MKLCWEDKQSLVVLQNKLNNDEAVLLSGDTVLGLFTRCSQKGYEALNTIKQRNVNPYLIVIHSVSVLDRFIEGDLPGEIQKLIDICWPGPITIIFKARQDLPAFMKSPAGTVALRVPDHAGLLALLEKFDGLFSTSANLHKEPIPTLLSDVDPSIMQQVGATCVDCSVIFSQTPSTIIDCSSGKITLIRKGKSLKGKVQHYIDKLLSK